MSVSQLQKLQDISDAERKRELPFKAILVSDSKGFTLRNQYWTRYGEQFPLTVWCKAGAKTNELIKDIVLNFESEIEKSPLRIYLWSGTCDLTTKTKGTIGLTEFGTDIVDTLTTQFYEIADTVNLRKGASLHILECPQYSFRTWNNTKGHKLDQEVETLAEEELHKQIAQLNFKIRTINSKHLEPNLRFDSRVTRSRKGKGKPLRKTPNLTLYTDGIHPGPLLAHAWINAILKDLNRAADDWESRIPPRIEVEDKPNSPALVPNLIVEIPNEREEDILDISVGDESI